MATKERREPKYHTIAADLSAKIRSGDYPPGTALPPQRELSATYGVTLATLRQALQMLEGDGLLSQQPGRGTFVAEPKAAYLLGSLRGFAEDLRAQGQTVSTEILGQAQRRLPAWVAAHLGADAGERALRLERTRLIAGRPAVHQVSWIREPAAHRQRAADLSAGSLYAALATVGVVVHRATETLRPGQLDESTAVLLRQPGGTPVFVSDRVTRGLDDAPVVFDRATMLGTVMEIRTDRTASGLSMRWSRPER